MEYHFYTIIYDYGDSQDYFLTLSEAVASIKSYKKPYICLKCSPIQGVRFEPSGAIKEIVDISRYIERVSVTEEKIKEIREKMEKVADVEIERWKKWLNPGKQLMISGCGTYAILTEENKEEKVNEWLNMEIEELSYKWKD